MTTTRANRGRLLLGAAALALLLGGLWFAYDRGYVDLRSGRTVHGPSGGPLEMSPGSTGITTQALGERFTMGFGANTLCTRDGVPVRIEGVRYRTLLGEEAPRTWFRLVPPAAQRKAPDADGWAPYMTLNGGHEGNAESYRPLGRFVPRLEEPLRIACHTQPDDDKARAELVFDVEVGPQGFDLTSIEIDYRMRTREFTLLADMDTYACGTKGPRPMCDRELRTPAD